MVTQGEIYWIDLPKPKGSEPGYRRPCVVVQNDTFNRSRIATTVIVILTSNLRLAKAPGNVLLRSNNTGLSQDSVANISQILTVNKIDLSPKQKIGTVTTQDLNAIIEGIRVLINRI